MSNFFFILSKLNSGFSLFRVFQLVEFRKIKIKNKKLADLGSLPNKKHNISYSKNFKNITYFNLRVENKQQIKNTVLLNFEKINYKIAKNYKSKFDKVFIFNLLEHIKNYKKPILFSKTILKKNGELIGSTPFLFRIHPSPKDYFRFTEMLLREELQELGFKNIKITPLGTGIFSMIINSLIGYNKYIPFINSLIYVLGYSLDMSLSIISNKNKITFPIGYFFRATKK